MWCNVGSNAEQSSSTPDFMDCSCCRNTWPKELASPLHLFGFLIRVRVEVVTVGSGVGVVIANHGAGVGTSGMDDGGSMSVISVVS